MPLELDRPRIPIRERSLADILDLSLKVCSALAGPLLLAAVAAALPLMVLNEWFLGGLIERGDEGSGAVGYYVWFMALLVVIEAPLASVPATMLLGKAMFFETQAVREMLVDLSKMAPRLVWHQLMTRGVAAAWALAATVKWQDDPSAPLGFLLLLTCFVALVRIRRPFLNEIILLEHAPWRGRDKATMTVRRRIAALHDPSVSQLAARWLASAAVAVLMTVAVALALWFVWWVLTFDQPWGPVMLRGVIPAAMWLVAGYFSVVRFLSYLDLRIRREGWEVELIVHAAAKGLEKPTVN